MAQPAFARIDDLFQFADNRLGRAVAHRIDADRLAAHPIRVKAVHGIKGGTSILATPLNDDEVARGIRSHHAGLCREIIEQLGQGLGRDILHWDDGNPVSRVRAVAGIQSAAAPHRLRRRYETVVTGIAHQRDVAHFERALEHVEEVLFRHRPAR